ncbi:MAG: hypothetical protein Q8S73_30530 [Deltaproteobacteria bacterium]|nr:hypothetical protein [Deltaproteobacteria bacterium]
MAYRHFFPYVRAGLARGISREATDTDHLVTTVAMSVVATGGGNRSAPIDAELSLLGPGHVRSLQTTGILRRDPAPGSRDALTTCFAQVEFAEPDLPWRYTPFAPSNGRLPPWLVLVVLRSGDGVRITRRQDSANATLTLRGDLVATELPTLDEAWAWAHVQAVSPTEMVDLNQIVRDRPQDVTSRLLCPRRLEPNVAYVAALVPAFRAGVEAGLARAVETTTLAPAWTGDHPVGEDLVLPVFDQWRFTTGEAGDLEDLAARLRPYAPPASLGTMLVDLARWKSASADDRPSLDVFSGVFRVPPTSPAPRPPEVSDIRASLHQQWAAARALSVTEPPPSATPADDPLVVPPRYGANYVKFEPLEATSGERQQRHPWYDELNDDPMHRAVARLGAETVRDHQEELLAAAWTQLEDARRAQRAHRQAQVASEVGRTMVQRVQAIAAPTEQLMLLRRLLPRLPAQHAPDPADVTKALKAVSTQRRILSTPFRRAMRPQTALARRVSRAQQPIAYLLSAVGEVTRAASTLSDRERFPVQRAVAITGDPANPRDPASPRDPANPRNPASPRTPVGTGMAVSGEGNSQARALVSAVQPMRAHADLLKVRGVGVGLAKPWDDEIAPNLTVGPYLTVPWATWLARRNPEFMLPGLGELPLEIALTLPVNTGFIEAFLAGANTAFLEELRWREYPVASGHTMFDTFWDDADSQDVKPLSKWKAALGRNAINSLGAVSTVVLRGELVRRYPDLLIYLRIGNENRLARAYGFLDVQTRYVCFEVDADELAGAFIVLEEAVFAPRFGLDTTITGSAYEQIKPGWGSHDVAGSDDFQQMPLRLILPVSSTVTVP